MEAIIIVNSFRLHYFNGWFLSAGRIPCCLLHYRCFHIFFWQYRVTCVFFYCPCRASVLCGSARSEFPWILAPLSVYRRNSLIRHTAFRPTQEIIIVGRVFLISIALLFSSWKPLQYLPCAHGRLEPIVKKWNNNTAWRKVDGTRAISDPFRFRKNIVNWVYTNQPVAETDFILIDSLFMPSWLHKEKELKELLSQLHSDPNWKPSMLKTGFIFFQKNSFSLALLRIGIVQ